MDRKQRKLIGEITSLTNAIVYYEVHMVVGCRLIDYFFLKILKANISKKLKFLFSNASARRPTTAGKQCGAENFVADTPKTLTHELQLISTSRFAHLC